MSTYLLSTLTGEILGLYTDPNEAREDATEIASVTREPLALHWCLFADGNLPEVGCSISMRGSHEIVR
jgi:hypothetical protein